MNNINKSLAWLMLLGSVVALGALDSKLNLSTRAVLTLGPQQIKKSTIDSLCKEENPGVDILIFSAESSDDYVSNQALIKLSRLEIKTETKSVLKRLIRIAKEHKIQRTRISAGLVIWDLFPKEEALTTTIELISTQSVAEKKVYLSVLSENVKKGSMSLYRLIISINTSFNRDLIYSSAATLKAFSRNDKFVYDALQEIDTNNKAQMALAKKFNEM